MDCNLLSALIGLMGAIVGAAIASGVTYFIEKNKEKKDNKETEINNLISILTEINNIIKEYELLGSSKHITTPGEYRSLAQSLFDRRCVDIVTLIELYISDDNVKVKVKERVDVANQKLNIIHLTESKQILYAYIKQKKT